MTNKKNLITLLGIAFVVAIIATGLFYGLVVNKLDNAAKVQDSVVVAARELKPGDVLAPGDVKLVPRTTVDALAGGFNSTAQMAGLVVMVSVGAGTPLERNMLASKDSRRGAALGIPPGLRAVSVHVADSTGVVHMLQPGHRVDVQVVTNGKSRGTKTLRTVLQDLEVLRVEEKPEASEGRPMLPVVTLLATPAAADALGVADAAARIRLVLRHPLDDRITKRASVALAAVLKNPPKPARRDGPVSAETSSESTSGSGQTVETARKR